MEFSAKQRGKRDFPKCTFIKHKKVRIIELKKSLIKTTMRNTKYLSKLLKLEEYIIDGMKKTGLEIQIECHAKNRGMWFKDQYSKKIVETRTRIIPHIMLENQRVVLIVSHRRFAFKRTRRWEKLPDVEKRQRTTNTFRLHTLRELQRDNYSGSGHKRQMSGMFPMKLLDELELKFKWEAGITRVGLDGKGVTKGKLVHHLANLDEGKSICILPNLSQKQLKKNSWKFQRKTD